MRFMVDNLPSFSGSEKDIFRSRVYRAIDEVLQRYYPGENAKNAFSISDLAEREKRKPEREEEPNAEKETSTLVPQEPQFTFDQIVLDAAVKQELKYAARFENVRDLVYNKWELRRIDPSPKLALNFHGPSGTGKTMAAHALSSAMGKKIIPASYAEIESKYVGDGPKNVKKLFRFASENNAVLFIDEADSLLSKRLTNIEHGSEQSLNSMRSQLLIEIEKYSGTVIFATNLAANYDGAFKTRMRSILFNKPSKELRRHLWEKMLTLPLPLAPDIDFDKLSDVENVVGRDIKNAVVKAAVSTAINSADGVTQSALIDAINEIIESNKEMDSGGAKKLSETEKREIGAKIRRKLQERARKSKGRV